MFVTFYEPCDRLIRMDIFMRELIKRTGLETAARGGGCRLLCVLHERIVCVVDATTVY